MTTSTQPAALPPEIITDDLNEFFWNGVKEHKLLILRCQECGHYVHFPRPMCDRCQSMNLAPAAVSGKGTLFMWTVPLQPFDRFFAERVPYIYAVVELAEEPGLRFITNIVDCAAEDLKLGMPVELTWREIAPDYTLPLFKPA